MGPKPKRRAEEKDDGGEEVEVKVDPASVLPLEMLYEVFIYLRPKDLASCCLVSSAWRSAANGDPVWRRKCSENAISGLKSVLALQKNRPFKNTRQGLAPLGIWSQVYRLSYHHTLDAWAENRPLKFNNFNGSKRDLVFFVHTDGRTVAVTYPRSVVLYNLTVYPPQDIQTLEQDLGFLEHRKAYVAGNLVIVKDRNYFKAYIKVNDEYTFHSKIELKDFIRGNLEAKDIFFTPDYIYITLSKPNMTSMEIHVWSSTHLKVVDSFKLPDGYDAWASGESLFFLNASQGNVLIRTGLKQISLSLGTVSKFRSNRQLITFLLKDTKKSGYKAIVTDHSGKILWEEESALELTHIQPLRDWGFCYRILDPDNVYNWVVKSFSGREFTLSDRNIIGRPHLIGTRYILYQDCMMLCLYDMASGRTRYRRACGYFSHELIKDCLVFHESYDFEILYYRDKHYL